MNIITNINLPTNNIRLVSFLLPGIILMTQIILNQSILSGRYKMIDAFRTAFCRSPIIGIRSMTTETPETRQLYPCKP